MPSSPLSPEPPHLSFGLYSEHGERLLLSQVCAAIGSGAGGLTGVIGVAPRDSQFELVSDLGADYYETEFPLPHAAAVVSDADPELRAVRVGLRHELVGAMVAGYDWSDSGADHAVSVLAEAGPLGVPDEIWTGAERRRARKRAERFVALMRHVCDEVDPLYGAVGVEMSMPTPRLLARSRNGLGDLYVSDRLMSRSPALRDGLSGCFAKAQVDTWGNGTYFSSWGPFNGAGVSAPHAEEISREAVRLLGRALAR
ncbi:hypothetical protein AB0C27_54765 [Nonomuraea sp. NPDC048882]|uniref:hypothetical protein n=1 Tax=unclassified Nonomuraea TaxID=2593643 RepID=UPI000ADA67F9